MSARRSTWTGGAVGIAALIGAWSLLSTTVFGPGDGVPTPWAVVASVFDDGWTFYSPHVEQTVGEALTGYLVGNALALGLAVLVLLVPVLERVITQIAVASYCLPIVAIGPILSLVLDGDKPMSAMAGLSVFFTTLIGALLGLRSADPASLDLVRAYGGGRWQQMLRVRLIAALPSTLAALKIAGPAALLGAIIGEYLGRVDSGLGIAMTIAQQQLDVPRTWGIALVSGAVAGIAYGTVGLIARYALPWSRTTTVEGGGA
ncbi:MULTISPECIES: ABC transporter permease [unclassified Streptomyces]|jgi:ABC-type nitrate/sulfonate/bicarbonate transport system permease component|uniref:ABC transporter permease n=1 Tax=unclassified Streptomyces TaxID=2593676 RepID=UPI000851A6DA|nr:ABC transporter permease subunit [Streptomyces sp. LUP47B]